MATEGNADERWFAVRCVFKWPAAVTASGRTYEERVTLWRSSSFEEAVARAEAEAAEYAAAADPPLRPLDFAQVYELFEQPGEGMEVFSLLRDSKLTEEEYLSRYFTTGDERQGRLDE